MKDVAFIIPTTSRNRDWKNVEESYLWTILLKSLDRHCPDLDIHFYIGYDKNDQLFQELENQMKFSAVFHRYKFNWVPFKPDPGNVVKIWNRLADIASQKHDYLLVLGDDIRVPNDSYWLSSLINSLKKNDNLGWASGWSGNDLIATQFLIHKNHLKIFGSVFPPALRNYYCDDWMNCVYPNKYKCWNRSIPLLNCGGEPRYIPEDDSKICQILVKRSKIVLNNYLKR